MCRFVSEQMDRMLKGEDKETAAQAAMQALRSEGVDIKQREVHDLSGCGGVSMWCTCA